MAASSKRYIPSSSSIESVIYNLNECTQSELALPGNWSPQLFYRDLKDQSTISKRVLLNIFEVSNNYTMSYLDFL